MNLRKELIHRYSLTGTIGKRHKRTEELLGEVGAPELRVLVLDLNKQSGARGQALRTSIGRGFGDRFSAWKEIARLRGEVMRYRNLWMSETKLRRRTVEAPVPLIPRTTSPA